MDSAWPREWGGRMVGVWENAVKLEPKLKDQLQPRIDDVDKKIKALEEQ